MSLEDFISFQLNRRNTKKVFVFVCVGNGFRYAHYSLIMNCSGKRANGQKRKLMYSELVSVFGIVGVAFYISYSLFDHITLSNDYRVVLHSLRAHGKLGNANVQ